MEGQFPSWDRNEQWQNPKADEPSTGTVTMEFVMAEQSGWEGVVQRAMMAWGFANLHELWPHLLQIDSPHRAWGGEAESWSLGELARDIYTCLWTGWIRVSTPEGPGSNRFLWLGGLSGRYNKERERKQAQLVSSSPCTEMEEPGAKQTWAVRSLMVLQGLGCFLGILRWLDVQLAVMSAVLEKDLDRGCLCIKCTHSE